MTPTYRITVILVDAHIDIVATGLSLGDAYELAREWGTRGGFQNFAYYPVHRIHLVKVEAE